MEAIFNLCVGIIIWISDSLGISYQTVNIWIFVILHPLLTFVFFWLMIKYRNKWKNEAIVNELLLDKTIGA